jgi:hypothetical protein
VSGLSKFREELGTLANRCREAWSNSEHHWYLVYDGNVVLDRIKRLIAELDRKLEAQED